MSIALLEAKLEDSRKFRTGTLPPGCEAGGEKCEAGGEKCEVAGKIKKLEDKITNLSKTWH